MTSLGGRIDVGVRGLTPGNFALVMATGIISVGLQLVGVRWLSQILVVVAAVALGLLLILTMWRLVAHRDAVVADFLDPRRAFGFFTTIAGMNVVGVRLAMEGYPTLTAILLAAAGCLWLVLGYVIPWTAVLGPHRRPIIAAANGTWFIWVVASQSVAISAATLELVYEPARRVLAIVAVFSWSVGVFLYAAAGVFVAARMMLYDFGPRDLTPPYWVAMGAAAITVLAGARIVEMADAPMVTATRGLIAGASVMFWAFATWLIRHWLRPGGGGTVRTGFRSRTKPLSGRSSSLLGCTPWRASISARPITCRSSGPSAARGSGWPLLRGR
jgi:amino acid transporter